MVVLGTLHVYLAFVQTVNFYVVVVIWRYPNSNQAYMRACCWSIEAKKFEKGSQVA